jgi:hypothetical protein
MTERPSGITIIAGLQVFGAILSLIIMIIIFPNYIFFKNILVNELYKIFMIIMIITSFFAAYGLLKGMKWAWVITIIFQIISIISNTINLNILSITFGVLIIYYLTRPHIKDFFEKNT